MRQENGRRYDHRQGWRGGKNNLPTEALFDYACSKKSFATALWSSTISLPRENSIDTV